jgi:hypothetical protein
LSFTLRISKGHWNVAPGYKPLFRSWYVSLSLIPRFFISIKSKYPVKSGGKSVTGTVGQGTGARMGGIGAGASVDSAAVLSEGLAFADLAKKSIIVPEKGRLDILNKKLFINNFNKN